MRLLDARDDGLDEPGLRAAARALAGAARAPHASRSYRYPYALVAWHDAPVGVDIERAETFETDFLASICTPSELELLDGGVDMSALWCSKEALAKALGDPVAYDPRRLGSPLFWPGGRSGPWRAAALPVPSSAAIWSICSSRRDLSATSQHNAWLCWRERGDT